MKNVKTKLYLTIIVDEVQHFNELHLTRETEFQVCPIKGDEIYVGEHNFVIESRNINEVGYDDIPVEIHVEKLRFDKLFDAMVLKNELVSTFWSVSWILNKLPNIKEIRNL